jgi:hypothetical protein
MAPSRARGYLRGVKLLIFWLGRLVPATILIVIGVAEIIAGYVPALKERIGHAPLPLSIGGIVLGCLSVALSFWIVRVHQRYRKFVASRRAHA